MKRRFSTRVKETRERYEQCVTHGFAYECHCVPLLRIKTTYLSFYPL
jgi:hypothetical protein